MPGDREAIVILMADDDPEDTEMAREALDSARLANELHIVGDGEELLDYLNRRGNYQDPASSPQPGLILLDLNMPKMDGREALSKIKANEELRRIPVVVLTTSSAEEDIYRSYDLGVSGYITKPVSFAGLVDAMSQMGSYWFELVQLPDR